MDDHQTKAILPLEQAFDSWQGAPEKSAPGVGGTLKDLGYIHSTSPGKNIRKTSQEICLS